jgi:hypothetical protein
LGRIRGHAASTVDHIGQGVRAQVLAHVVANLGPDVTENALALVVASTIFVWCSKVSHGQWTIDRSDDLGQGDL